MTNDDHLNKVIKQIRAAEAGTSPRAGRPEGFWLRLLRSLRIRVKPGKSFRQPIREVTITGGTEL